MEILLTQAQGFLGFMMLINLVFTWYEAVGLFVLWLFQFMFPDSHVFVTAVYFAWCGVELVRIFLGRRPLTALKVLPELLRHGLLAAKDHKPH